MAKSEMAAVLLDIEIEGLEIALATKASKLAMSLDEYINMRRLHGATMAIIRQDLLLDLEEGGRLFGEFRNAVRATANGSINRFRDVGQFSETGVEKGFKWAAVLVNTCPDCLERHGQTKSWDEWEDEGLPRTGATVCREHCKCMLVPEDTVVLEPIKRG